MLRTKENHSGLTQRDYVRYLYQEGVRHGIHKKPNFYPELIKFVNSPDGIEGFNKFVCLDPKKIGVTTISSLHLFKRAFQS